MMAEYRLLQDSLLSHIDRFLSRDDRDKLCFLAETVVPNGLLEETGSIKDIQRVMENQQGISRRCSMVLLKKLLEIIGYKRFGKDLDQIIDRMDGTCSVSLPKKLYLYEILVKICDQLGRQSFFLLKARIPDEQLHQSRERIKTPVQLFRRLLQLQTLSVEREEESLALLHEWLVDIGRLDIVQNMKMHSRPAPGQVGMNNSKHHKEAYEKALKEKVKVKIRLVRFNYIGIPRSGKSSFRRRLSKEISNLQAIEKRRKQQRSTGVAEVGEQVFIKRVCSNDIGTIQSGVWSVVKGLGGEANILGHLLNESTTKCRPLPKSSQSCSFISILLSLCAFFASISKSFLSFCGFKPAEIPSQIPSGVEGNLDVIFDIAVEVGDWEEVKYLLGDTILLINADTGGQAEFLDLQASLIQGPSFNLLFSRLVDDLDSQFEVYYTNSGGESTMKENSLVTVEEVLLQSLSSISCYSGTFSEDNSIKASNVMTPKLSECKVMFVGTHRDLVSQDEFERKDKILQKVIEGTPFHQKGIIEYAKEGQLMIPVDNWTGNESEVDAIQQILANIIQKGFEEIEIPASWLVLSLQMRSKNLCIVSLEECEALAEKLGISPSELQHALWFLHHRMGVFFYYPELDALKGTVICDIQVVFDSTTNLIRNTFTFDKVGNWVSKEFREKAQFSLKNVQDAMMVPKDGLIPLEKLVVLLEYLGILTAIPPTLSSGGNSVTEPTYFMPCVLRSATASELSVHSHRESDPAPLILCYDCGYVPIGIFPSLITNLVSQKLSLWEMIGDGLRKNRVQFHVGKDYDTVTLISRPRYLQISLSRSESFKSPTESVCSHVRQVIQSTLATVTSRTNYRFSMGYKFGFECPAHPGREHICVLDHDEPRRMKCLQNKKDTFPLEKRHQVWFSSGHEAIALSLNAMKLLKWKDEWGRVQTFRLVDKVSSRWMDFGHRVGVENNLLVAWEEQFLRNSARCWCEVMTQWLVGGGRCEYPVSWVGLYEMLGDVGFSEVAAEVQKVVASAVKLPHIHQQNQRTHILSFFTRFSTIPFWWFMAMVMVLCAILIALVFLY